MIREKASQVETKVLLRDTFARDKAPGTVIGSQTANQQTRQGVDLEGVIGIDNGALRIEPMIQAGWGRAGIVYGPFSRTDGLAFAVFMLNGHNTSQLDTFPDSLLMRLRRWALGSATRSESKMVLVKRLARWVVSDHSRSMIRRLRWWRRLRLNSQQNVRLDENLAVGWFPQAVLGLEFPEGSAFVMHALGAENGELWAIGGETPLPAVVSVQNIPLYFVIVLREHGAAYYAASSPNAHGLTAYPHLRPLAIEPFRSDTEVYAGIHQSVLGQIGFRSNSRVYGVSVAQLAQFSDWYGTAHAADSLIGSSDLDDSEAVIGGVWSASARALRRTLDGVIGAERGTIAWLRPDTSSGLVHAIIASCGDGGGFAGLVWRAVDSRNYWALQLGDQQCHLSVTVDGENELVASSEVARLEVGGEHSLQILDDGGTFAAFLNGTRLFDRCITDSRFNEANGVGVYADTGAFRIHHFEAHPRTIAIPTALDLGAPWHHQGEQIVISELFDGEARMLEGKLTTTGTKVWERSLGRGIIDVIGDGTAKVRASAAAPNPGRTGFTIAWDTPEFADLQLEMVPPGAARGQDEKGRCGLVFWQDADNYIIVSVYLDDSHPGVSISSFFHLNGFEELYDAVWTMMTRHVTWGKPFRLRVVFDGIHYMAFVNDEPVLYRALTDVYPKFKRLSIPRVGLLVNWEWGDDTGSTLNSFIAKV